MSSIRQLNIFQTTRSSSQKKPTQSSNSHPNKTQFDTCYGLPVLEDDTSESEPDHEIFDSSQSEEQKDHITLQNLSEKDSSSTKLPPQSSSQKPSNDQISSVAELNKIIEQIKNPKNHKNSQSKMPRRRKRICKNPKPTDSVKVGQFFVGRLKKRNRIKPKVTLNDVDQIYRCQCGKDYLSYMGIYRHIKTVHLRKDQYQLFKLHTFKDHRNGKTIKTVIIQQSAKPTYHENDGQRNRNIKATVEYEKGDMIAPRPNIKLEDCKLEDLDLSLNYDEAINQSRELSQAHDFKVTGPTVSLSKYEKLIEDYHTLLNQRFEKEKEHTEITRKLMQENSLLYQTKEKYKLKLKLLQAKLQAQMIRLEANDSPQQQAPQQKSAEAQSQQNNLFEFSASSSFSCSLAQFSTLNLANSSEYGSSIQQVYSLGQKSESNRESSKRPIQNRIEPGKGLYFDPEASVSRSKDAKMNKNVSIVKQEEEVAGSIQSQNLSSKTSQKTPYFKGYESDTETEYDEEYNFKASRFKSVSYSQRSMKSL